MRPLAWTPIWVRVQDVGNRRIYLLVEIMVELEIKIAGFIEGKLNGWFRIGLIDQVIREGFVKK